VPFGRCTGSSGRFPPAQAIARAGTLDKTAINNQVARANGMFVAGHIKFGANHTSTLPMVEEQRQNGKNVIIAPLNRATAKVIFPLPAGCLNTS
jgi:hypothetical protein